MNFNIMDGEDIHDKVCYEDFKEDFLNPNFNMNDLMKKYDISFNKYNHLRKEVCEELGIKSKPRAIPKYRKIITNRTYIHKYGKKYGIFKKLNGERICFGFYDDLTTAQLVRDKLIKVNWDKNCLNKILRENNII